VLYSKRSSPAWLKNGEGYETGKGVLTVLTVTQVPWGFKSLTYKYRACLKAYTRTDT